MTIREIIQEIFTENKKWIYTYITLLCIFSVSMSTNMGGFLHATETGFVTENQASAMGGQTYMEITAISRSMGSGIDPVTVLGAEAVVALLGKISPEHFAEYTTGLGLMNSEIAIGTIFAIIFITLVLKILKSNQYTKVGGLTVEDAENKVGMLTGPVLTFVTWFSGQQVVQAAGMSDAMSNNILEPALSVVWMFMLTVVASVMYYIVRTVIYAGEILSMTFSLIPFSSMSIETAKAILTAFIVFAAQEHPWLVVLLFSIIFIICLFLFKKAYMIVRYFKNIYIWPIFKSKDKALVDEKHLQKMLPDAGVSDVNVFLPMFARTVFNDKVKKFDKCWLYVRDENIVVFKKRLFSKIPLQYWMKCTDARYFVNRRKRFIEIFTLDKRLENEIHNPLKPLKRQMHFIISREYRDNFEALEYALQMTNYSDWQKELRAKKKEEDERKRQQRREERQALKPQRKLGLGLFGKK